MTVLLLTGYINLSNFHICVNHAAVWRENSIVMELKGLFLAESDFKWAGCVTMSGRLVRE